MQAVKPWVRFTEPTEYCPTCGHPLEFLRPDTDIDYCLNCTHRFDAATVQRVYAESTAEKCGACGAILWGVYGPYLYRDETECWNCGAPVSGAS